MKRYSPFYATGFLLLSFFALAGMHTTIASPQQFATPTPTYDPLVEPPVPDNPTDYELGRNWYWHYCMPCHGDKGQGLTDEWRSVWEADHQDCWGRGCHSGKRIEDSFAIPTAVPPVVSPARLARFSSLQALFEFLKATHPPQNPGWLEDEQYRAIALYLFSENDRSLVVATSTPALLPMATSTPPPDTFPSGTVSSSVNITLYLGLGVIFFVVVIWGIRKRH
jgi:hypothetical protein